MGLAHHRCNITCAIAYVIFVARGDPARARDDRAMRTLTRNCAPMRAARVIIVVVFVVIIFVVFVVVAVVVVVSVGALGRLRAIGGPAGAGDLQQGIAARGGLRSGSV